MSPPPAFPPVSPLHTWLSCHSCSTFLSSTTFLFHHRSKQQTSLFCSSLPITHSHPLLLRQRRIRLGFLSCVSGPVCPLYLWLPADSDASYFFASALSAPTQFHPFLFFISFCLPLSRPLQVAVHNDGPVFPPVCQPFTCILATTSPLAPVLHVEQANKMPGE